MDFKAHKNSFFLIATALILPILVMLVMQFYRLIEERQSIEREALLVAQQISTSADMLVQSNLNTMQVLALSSAIMSDDWKGAARRIKEVADINPQWNDVFIVDIETGKKRVSIDTSEDRIANPAALSTIKDTKKIIQGIVTEGTNCPCIYLYVTIPSAIPPKYALGVSFNPADLQNILLQQVPQKYIAEILDTDGLILARNLRSEEVIGKISSTYARNAIAQKKAGIYAGVTLEGLENYTGFQTSSLTGWSTHVAVPSSLIDRPKFLSSLIAGIACVFTLIFGGAMVFYVIRQFETGTAAHLAAIIESSDDIIVSKDLNGVVTTWNDAAERILGFSADEAVGKHISLIIPEDRYPEEDEIIRNIRAGNRISHFETLRRRKDGKLIDLSITVSPIKDKSGRVIGASKIARDISDRKLSEMQLAEERNTLETLNRLSPKIAATLDLQSLIQTTTDEATKLVGANFGAFFYNTVNDEGKAYRLYTLSGAPKEAFEGLGMPRITRLLGPTFRGESSVLSDDITQDARYGDNEPYNGMPDGHLPVRSYLAVPVISRGGEVIGGLLFGHQEPAMFTEREMRLAEGIAAFAAIGIDNARLYDEVLAGRRKAEEASRAKSDFLATMSHEIRTPMNAIVGISHILTATATDKQVHFVKTLQAAADSLLILINDLLDISKIESNSIELEEVPFSIKTLFQEIFNLLNMKASDKGIRFTVETADAENIVFLGDMARLRQIVSNLCSNAIKFTDHGFVSLKAGAEIGPDKTAKLRLTVQDSGIGIAEDKKDVIFEKFVQADTSINRKYGGTGLGLSITKELVEAMGGTITVESTVGVGSVFSIDLPLKIMEAGHTRDTLAAQPTSHAAGPEKKILLVEDYEPNIVVATAFLEMFGYKYDVARNGLDALEKIKTDHFDVVLMDLQMPGLNGFETTKAIRALKRKNLAHIPIIGMTAHAMAGDKELCLQAGMNDYISKPFDPADLREKIAKAAASPPQQMSG